MDYIKDQSVKKIKLDYNRILAAIPMPFVTYNVLNTYILVKWGNCDKFKGFLYVPQVLIDSDYPKSEMFLYLCNYSGVNITVDKNDQFNVIYEVGFDFPNNFYPMHLRIFMDYFGLPAHIARVVRLHKSSPGANGIDITFEHDYTIASAGSLFLNICWHYNLQLEKYPCLFTMRSRYAKRGIVVYEINDKGILLTNLSKSLVYLGDRFLQIVLPIPYIFEDGSANYIDQTNKIHPNLLIEFLDKKERKLKK